ncbi:MAG TPA: helix-turn-helix domain-containing GNAT family N-acetyltransferase [Baekduia sp.]|uniref:bifunctional helix-turn-helix transcriptional regulator/GNAT family N-acetyltransferase n=1 Tax=Baekduia sp. TaxID=2600305 RepID=UPI002D77E7E1|nr:helix-turn-helix domain-containing GNAT family N-acetyltransferase [Baekduia sp.]HET6506287.1 helix-turn-helix domain-containing GNAT family N-acetyltransferase [Baekduia sp.]
MTVDAAREFTRFYTNRIGVLRGGLHGSRHPLPEARVLYELGHADGPTEVAALRATLDMDAGQLSRLLARLDDDGLVVREKAERDARRLVLRLTAQGRRAFAKLDRGSATEWAQLLDPLSEGERARLVGAMGAVREILGDDRAGATEVVLRDPEPGDLGWIVARHGAVYAAEFGWGLGFEALCARVVADYAEAAASSTPGHRAWIATAGGAPAGCVLSVRGDEPGDAKLRLLLVEPWARGLGVGGTLIDAVVADARANGDRRVVLWTNSPLTAARRLYDRRGFRLIAEEPHADWGIPMTGQVLALDL